MKSTELDGAAARVRVGDAERDKCVSELIEHHLHGRLSSEEFDARERLALEAVTLSDLGALTEDLPSEQRRATFRPFADGLARRRGRDIAPSRAQKVARSLWPAGILWGGAFLAQTGNSTDWWNLSPDITTGFLMGSFGYVTHWGVTKFRRQIQERE